MAKENGNDNDIVHAKLPISTVFTVGGFLVAQIIAFTYFVANLDNRISSLEFENQRLSMKITESEEKIEEEKHDSRLQSLEMKMGTLHEKVYNGRSRSHDSILKIQGLIANHDYRLSNIEASVSIKVNSGNRYNPHDN
tara:strand:+ start:1481 stop:1894 length:414 start_codon:yes stop_codon:yes gene_type:complete